MFRFFLSLPASLLGKRLGYTASLTFDEGRTQGGKLGLMVFKQAQAGADNFARRGIAVFLDLTRDEILKMVPSANEVFLSIGLNFHHAYFQKFGNASQSLSFSYRRPPGLATTRPQIVVPFGVG